MKLQHLKFFSIVLTLGIAAFAFGTQDTHADDISANITIPVIGVNAPIVDAPLAGNTWDVSHLDMTVGRFESLAWFGSNTNVVLGGHSLTPTGQPDVFFNLSGLAVGDDIFVNADGVDYHFVVTEVFSVSQYQVDVLDPTPNSQITLLACDSASFNPETGFERRTVVIATQVIA